MNKTMLYERYFASLKQWNIDYYAIFKFTDNNKIRINQVNKILCRGSIKILCIITCSFTDYFLFLITDITITLCFVISVTFVLWAVFGCIYGPGLALKYSNCTGPGTPFSDLGLQSSLQALT